MDVLVLEDAHWADEVTLEFLLFLTSRQRADGPSLVISYRPEEVDAGSLLLRLTSRLPVGVTGSRIALASVAPGDTASLVSSMLGGEPVSDAFRSFLHERTGGVPWRSRSLSGSCAIARTSSSATGSGSAWRSPSSRCRPRSGTPPESGWIRLSPAAQQTLRAAAVLAEWSSEAALASTAGLTPEEARAGIAEAADARILSGDERGRWRFRHVLVATAVYEAVARTDRALLHRRAGEALESVDPQPVARLAHHFREAGAAERWARYAERAAAQAMASGDNTTAVVLLVDLLSEAALPPADLARIARTTGLAALGRREPVDEVYHRVVRGLRTVLDGPGPVGPRAG